MNSTPEQLDGRTEWRNNQGLLHRTDGPAIEWVSGTKSWWVNGLRHRTDAPAIEYSNGMREWWINGKQVGTTDPRYIQILAAATFSAFATCWLLLLNTSPEERDQKLQFRLTELTDEVQKIKLMEKLK